MLKQLTVTELNALYSEGFEGECKDRKTAYNALDLGPEERAYTTDAMAGIVLVRQPWPGHRTIIYDYYGDFSPIVLELLKENPEGLCCHLWLKGSDYALRAVPIFFDLGFMNYYSEPGLEEGHIVMCYEKDYELGFTDFTAKALALLEAIGVHTSYEDVRQELIRKFPSIITLLAPGLRGDRQ